jgi:vitamin B12/bleomycin/antimicrobial peptide transport system ATP-binding/permease protein
MKPLSISLVLFGLLALVRPAHQLDLPGAVLGIVVLLCAATTFRSSGISSFLKIFVGIFSAETIVFGLAVLAGRAGLWPTIYAEYLPPKSLPLTVAIFSIIVYVVAQFGTVGQITRIADRYFTADEVHSAHVWPFGPFTTLERRLRALRHIGAAATQDDDNVHRPSFGSGQTPPSPPRNASGRRHFTVGDSVEMVAAE